MTRLVAAVCLVFSSYLLQFLMLGVLVPSVRLLDETVSSEASKQTARLLMRNSHCATIYSALYGRSLPSFIIADIKKTKQSLIGGTLDETLGMFVPRHFSLGDIERLGDAEESMALESWFADNTMPVPRSQTTDVDKAGSLSLDRFYTHVLMPHVIDPDNWSLVDTMMILLYLYSYQDFVPALYDRYASRLGAGVVTALEHYRLNLKTRPLAADARNFDVALILHVMHHVLPL